MAIEKAPAAESRSYWPLVPAVTGLSMVVTTVGFLAPLLVLMAGEFEVSVAQVGQLVVLTAIPWALVAPFSGLLSDRFGRRPVIITALTGMGIATIAGAFSGQFWQLALLRLLTGSFGSGGPPTIMAGLVDHYPPHQRGQVIGWSNTSFSIANLVGIPVIGAIGGAWGWRVAFLVTGAAMILAAVFIWLAYPKGVGRAAGGGNPLRAYGHLFGLPHLGTFLLSNLFERVTFMVFSLYLASFLIQSYNRDPVSVAPLLFATAIGTFVGAVAGGSLADRVDKVKLAAGTLALSGLFGLATFGWPAGVIVSVATGFGFGLTNAASRPPFMSLLLGLSDLHRGALNGLIAMSNQFGWAIGAGVGGLILGFAGYDGLGVFILAFGVLSAVLVVAARSVDRPISIGPAPVAAGADVAAPQSGNSVAVAQPSPIKTGLGDTGGLTPSPAVARWIADHLAAERERSAILATWAARMADPELAEVIDLAAARAGDRAFRLRRAARSLGAEMPEPSRNGHLASSAPPSNGRTPDPHLLPKGTPPDPADGAGLLGAILTWPRLYAGAEELPDLPADLIATLKDDECEVLSILRDVAADLGTGRRIGLWALPAHPAGIDPRGVIRQVLWPGSSAGSEIARWTHPPGTRVTLAAAPVPRLIHVLGGSGHCGPDTGPELPLIPDQTIAFSAGTDLTMAAAPDEPLSYLVIGGVEAAAADTTSPSRRRR